MLIFPLLFVSGIFVPIDGMPVVLRAVAEWSPLGCAATACRRLFGNPVGRPPHVWPLDHSILATLLWIVAITAVFAPLAVRRYRVMAG